MNIADWSIRCWPIVITVSFLLMFSGVVAIATMPRREDPEYTVRTCAVTTTWPGATAQKIEELITKPIEEACDRIDEVDEVRSTTILGLSTVYVDAEETVPPEAIDNVWDKVRANVSRVQMPEEGITPVVNDEYGDTYIILFAVYQQPAEEEAQGLASRTYTLRELDEISETIKDELRLLPGVAKSEQYGVVEEAIYLETDLATWSKLNLTTNDLQKLITARNIVAPGGTLETDAGRFAVKPSGELNAVDELNSVIAAMVGTQEESKRPVYLQDLGLEVSRDYQDPPGLICRFGDSHGSHPAVIVALSMKDGANIIDICEAAKERVGQLQEEKALPPDIKVVPVSDQSQNVEAKIGQVVQNVIGAIVIVVVVVYLVVGFRSAAVMASNIPVVVLAALALVPLLGVQLEQISLASLIIALGLLVDNAVQVCDQSRFNQRLGLGPQEATVKGTNQLSTAMLMGTATTVAAFAPMLVGLIGSKREYVYSLPVTLSVTLGVSWLLAMTLCTVLAAAVIRPPKDPSAPSSPLVWLLGNLFGRPTQNTQQPENSGKGPSENLIERGYAALAHAAIGGKYVTVGLSVVLLVAALMLPVGSEFFPQDRRDQFAIEIWLPESATIAQTDTVAREVESILQDLSPAEDSQGKPIQRLRAMRTMVGGGGSRWYLSWDPEPRQPNFAEILVRTTDGIYTSELARRVREVAENGDAERGRQPIVGARVVPRELMLGPSSDPVELRVIGPGFADMRSLRRIAEDVKGMLRETPGTWDIHDSWGVSGYQLRVDPDDRANLAGVTNDNIAQTLNAYFSGHQLTSFREGDHVVPIYLRLQPEQRASLEGLETAYVEGANGKVPLNSVATIEPRWEPSTIVRRDLNRTIEVRSQVEPGIRGNDVVIALMQSEPMKQLQQSLPTGYHIEVGGSLEDSQEGSEQFGVCLLISIVAIVLLLIIQYNGWAKPTIILSTLPLALIGALPGLWITGNPLGFMPQLGILALFGIVLNTGIIFIEFADLLIKEAAEQSDRSGPICGLTTKQFRQCLVNAGKQRMLPIFLTTATTVGGLLPLAIGGGPLWEGMSWCMIFGLLVATLLTLLVIPALYAILVETFGVQP